jgi:uncharacterized membrane protein
MGAAGSGPRATAVVTVMITRAARRQLARAGRREGGRMEPRASTIAGRGHALLERAALVTDAATAARAAQGSRRARADRERIAAFGIDCQVAFCTPGAASSCRARWRTRCDAIEWLYRNLGAVTTLVLPMDTHSVHQVFHPAAWVDAEGRHPPPFTVISTDDVRRGRWIPVLRPEGVADVAPSASTIASSSRRAAATSSPSGRTTRSSAGPATRWCPRSWRPRSSTPWRGGRRPCSR